MQHITLHFLSSNTKFILFVIQSNAIMAKAYLLFTNPQKAEGRNALGALLLDTFHFI